MAKRQQAFGDDATSRAQVFAGTKCFLKAETLLKMSSTADDHQQHGQRHNSTGKKTSSIRLKFNSQNAC
jgi:hypothetical protein